MAGALRPVVILMILASGLFVTDGYLDGVYPGGPAWFGSSAYQGLGVLSYVFAAINLIIALLIATGSERTLVGRIGLSLFFLVERPVTAFLLGPKPTASIAVHLATALIELAILLSALRVWRLGHGVEGMELDSLLSLDAPSPAPPAVPAEHHPAAQPRNGTPVIVALLTMILAIVLVSDGLVSGFVPGGRGWGFSGEASGWQVYLFAVVLLLVASRAVHGGPAALRIMLVLSLILFLERAFSPLALKLSDSLVLALHALAAFVALGLALACVGAIRTNGSRERGGIVAQPTT
ncbi:MAG: hypothetical protein HY071_04470 [Chloroflexi bacterium]|nr:hypothetical protein [Chloroflexota bacterium]